MQTQNTATTCCRGWLFRLCADYADHLYVQLSRVIDGAAGDQHPGLLVFDHTFWPGVHALSLRFGIPAVALLPGLSGLEFLGEEEPSTAPMIISGLPAPVQGFLPRLKNVVMLRVGRHVLQAVRAGEHAAFAGTDEWAAAARATQNPYGKSRLALAGSFPGLGELSRASQASINSPMVQLTGPWLPRQASAPLPTAVQTFLDKPAPTVFISIGTNAVWTTALATAFFETLAKAGAGELQALWAIKQEQLEAVTAATGWAVGSLSNLMVVNFVDQLQVLQHPNTKAFVSHCGFGSMQEALFAGVPLLAMPMMLESDQVTNGARLVGNLKVALSFDARPVKNIVQFGSIFSFFLTRELDQIALSSLARGVSLRSGIAHSGCGIPKLGEN
jgi:hypothetical protein